MKRVLTFLAIMLLPLSVWAMTPVTDSDLADVTGQAGVSINADISMDINIGTMAWGDDNGVEEYWNGSASGGFVGMDNFNISNLRIQARATDDGFNGYTTMFLKPITIDVATDTTYDAISGYTDTTFVRFGLGALQISLDAMSFNVGTGAWQAVGDDVTIDQQMGSVNLGAMNIYINPMAYVDIYSHGAQGVNFTMAVVIDRLELGYVSWGDSDGLNALYDADSFEWVEADTDAGYVGLNGLYLGDADDYAVAVLGNVAIDVMTSAAGQGVYSALPAAINGLKGYFFGVLNPTYDPYNLTDAQKLELMTYIAVNGPTWIGNIQGNPAHYAAYGGTAYDTSVVHISFPGGLSVNMGSLRSQVCLDSVSSLDTGAGVGTGVMGDIYLQSLGVNIYSGSWVDIWAH